MQTSSDLNNQTKSPSDWEADDESIEIDVDDVDTMIIKHPMWRLNMII
jgi:hypothetical protein